MLTGRQRVLDAIARREPDRVPVDLGGSMVEAVHEFGRY